MTNSKYGNQKTEIDGIMFDSRHEAQRWAELKLMEKAGEIYDLQRQVVYELIPSQRKYGKVIERPCKYIADFVYRTKAGDFVAEDAKSPATRTAAYKIKKKLMLYKHGIEIKEV